MITQNCTYIEMPLGEEVAVNAIDSIIGDYKVSDELYFRDTSDNLSYIHSPNDIKVEKGVTLTNRSRSWEYKIGERDKRVKLIRDRSSIIEMEVINQEQPTPTGIHIENGTISHVTFMSIGNSNPMVMNVSNDLTIMLSDDYKCISCPFPRFHINVKSRARLFP
jgi:hypothetical protein